MPIKVVVVDDSHFFQHRLAEIINDHPELQVVGVASNGREAIDMVASKRPDVVTMDYEMPLMDGVTAVREIMQRNPLPILMLSSLTYEGARITLDALEAGAVDFLPKNFAEVSRKSPVLKEKLHERLLTLVKQKKVNVGRAQPIRVTEQPVKAVSGSSVVAQPTRPQPTAAPIRAARRAEVNIEPLLGSVKLLAIGASTGGPVALAEILKALPRNFPLPILLIQHMPENFTRAFAERLNQQCQISVRLAEDGMPLVPGAALLAPGGKQMLVDSKQPKKIKVLNGDDRLNYKPSVDITLASAANSYRNQLLAMVLTGMGSDGCQGCRVVKEAGGRVWSQDQASSVIYGMPMAVAKAQLTDKVLALGEFAPALRAAFRC